MEYVVGKYSNFKLKKSKKYEWWYWVTNFEDKSKKRMEIVRKKFGRSRVWIGGGNNFLWIPIFDCETWRLRMVNNLQLQIMMVFRRTIMIVCHEIYENNKKNVFDLLKKIRESNNFYKRNIDFFTKHSICCFNCWLCWWSREIVK